MYNSKTGCMAKLDQTHYESFHSFVSQNIEISDKKFESELKQCGFIIEDDISELEQIRYRLLQSRFTSNMLSLVIAPTQNCNFRCTYCYEKEQLANCSMNKKTQDNILEFVKKHITKITDLNIEWYGGEPLLELNTIQYLSKEFEQLCNNNHVRYTSSMITNGYLLDEKVISILNTCNISQLQVTLDGIKATHDKRRMFKDGSGTFDIIVHNLSLCKLFFEGKVVLRINIDKKNLDEVEDVKELLKTSGIDDYVTIYLGKVTNINNTCEESNCLQTYEFAERKLAYMLKKDSSDKYFQVNYPKPIGNCCGADFNMSYVIGPDGMMYKCYMEIGCVERAIGNINDAKKSNKVALLYRYMLFDPTEDIQCSKCKYLPLCLGGCPKSRFNGVHDCTEKKHYINAYMQYMLQQVK